MSALLAACASPAADVDVDERRPDEVGLDDVDDDVDVDVDTSDDGHREPTAEPPTEPLAVPPTTIERDPERIAELLGDPATAVDGAWGLAAALGLGVYTGDGRQLLAGSERSVDDLWLYDVSMRGLASMTTTAPRSFAEFHDGLVDDGLDLTVDELLVVYAAALEVHPDAPISRLLAAVGFDPGSPPDEISLDAATSWLLLLALAPANPGAEELSFMPASVSTGDCSGVVGDGRASDWAIVSKVGDEGLKEVRAAVRDELISRLGQHGRDVASKVVRWLGRAAKVGDALTVATALASVTTELTATPFELRRLQDAEPAGSQRAEITATVTSTRVPPASCGPLAGLDLPGGPLENAGVELSIDPFLLDHGHLRDMSAFRQLTGSDGQVRVRYQTIHDDPPDAHRTAEQHQGRGNVRARFNVLGALGEWFNVFASVELLTRAIGVHERWASITVFWHEDSHRWVDATVIVDLDDVPNRMGIRYDLYACDGLRGDWHGDVHLFSPEEGPADQTTVSFGFDGGSETDLTWTMNFGFPTHGNLLAVVDDDGGEWMYLLGTVRIEGHDSWIWDASLDTPIARGDDARCD